MIKFKNLLLVISLSVFFIIHSCELYNTYSEDEYMKIGLKPETEEEIIKKDLYIKQFSTTSIIDDGGLFNFDLVPAIDRCNEITFEIFNNGTTDLNLTGTPKIQIGSSDFVADCLTLPDIVGVGESAVFTIQYVSGATDDLKKSTLVNIPNSCNNNYIFNISCTAKLAGSIWFKTADTHTWPSPVAYGNVLVSLAGGGAGGGGGSSTEGGGGGGSGWLEEQSFNILSSDSIYTVVIGNGGSGGGGRGTGSRGGDSQFLDSDLNALLSADGGYGGTGASNDHVGSGGNLNGENGGENEGGNGGAIIFREVNMGYGQRGTDNDESGKSAPEGSGGGGGGGGDAGSSGSHGGNGGSGFALLEWEGFVIP